MFFLWTYNTDWYINIETWTSRGARWKHGAVWLSTIIRYICINVFMKMKQFYGYIKQVAWEPLSTLQGLNVKSIVSSFNHQEGVLMWINAPYLKHYIINIQLSLPRLIACIISYQLHYYYYRSKILEMLHTFFSICIDLHSS